MVAKITIPVTVSMSPEMEKKCRILAAEKETSRSEIIRMAVRKYFETETIKPSDIDKTL